MPESKSQKAYLDKDIPVPVLIEGIGIHEFVFNDIPRPALALLNELLIRELTLRIFVEVLHVRVGRSAVEVIVELLDVLAMIAYKTPSQ